MRRMSRGSTTFPALIWLLVLLAVVLCLPLLFLGAIFVLSAFHPDAVAQGKSLPRAAIGGILLLGGLLLAALAVVLARNAMRDTGRPGDLSGGVAGGQEPPGEINLKALNCPHCGGQVDASTARLNPEGTLTLTCPYCKGSFLIQEEPKW